MSAALLHAHVAAFNAGVRSGDYTEMLERFADDAELVFEGVPAGPFRGRDEIAKAYAEQPPDDTIEILDVQDGEPTVARYSWSRDAGAHSGRLILSERDGSIERLVVTFEREG